MGWKPDATRGSEVMKYVMGLILAATILCWCEPGQAHHVLGRPAYSLNEDSNTPPSRQVETQIGEYLVSYMVFPAFPRPNVSGRINLYLTHQDTGVPLAGEVTFKVRNDSWLVTEETEIIGTQLPDDSVYRQGFIFSEEGDYTITATFEVDGEPYPIDFPLTVGSPAPIGLLGTAVAIIAAVLLGVSIVQRKHLTGAKVRKAKHESSTDARSLDDSRGSS